MAPSDGTVSWHRAKWRAARKGNHDFGKLAWLRVDLDRARVLLDHDVMADRKPKPPVPSPVAHLLKDVDGRSGSGHDEERSLRDSK